MDRLAEHPELRSLVEWWDDAGLDVDLRKIDADLRRQPDRQSAREEITREDKPADPKPLKRKVSPVEEAERLARQAGTLTALKTAIERFDGCALKLSAHSTVFADGVSSADLMVIGEGPGRDEDLTGRPFVGRAGQLLDRMLGAIGRSRSENVYITNVNFWRPPGNRNPTPEELDICRPFVERHIALVQPKLIVAAGAVSARELLGTNDGIMRMRGREYTYQRGGVTCPMIPVMHPAYLLRRPNEKARAWLDWLTIEARLEALDVSVSGPR